MNFRTQVEKLYQRAVDEFTAGAEFKALESGNARKCEYDRFIVNVIRTHLRSPQLLAFLFSVAPPGSMRKSPAQHAQGAGDRRSGRHIASIVAASFPVAPENFWIARISPMSSIARSPTSTASTHPDAHRKGSARRCCGRCAGDGPTASRARISATASARRSTNGVSSRSSGIRFRRLT